MREIDTPMENPTIMVSNVAWNPTSLSSTIDDHTEFIPRMRKPPNTSPAIIPTNPPTNATIPASPAKIFEISRFLYPTVRKIPISLDLWSRRPEMRRTMSTAAAMIHVALNARNIPVNSSMPSAESNPSRLTSRMMSDVSSVPT